MSNRLFRKGLVAWIIVLFIGMSIIPISGNISLINPKKTTEGKTLYVGGDGPGNYSSIQEAINDASDGDTVFVYNDSSPYYENVIIDKSISLIGENRETTIIDGSGVGNTVTLLTKYINLSGFKIVNGGDVEFEDAGIDMTTISTKFCNIMENIICNNNFYGIRLFHAHNNTIKDNIIMDNVCGIHITPKADFNTFENNTIINDGICFWDANNNVISNNQIIHGSIRLLVSDYNTISNNSIYYGITVSTSDGNVIDNNIIENGSISFYNTQNNIISNNQILSGYVDLELTLGETIVNNELNKGIYISGYKDDYWTNHIIDNNFAQGKPILYLVDGYENIIEGDYAQVILVNCKYCTVKNLNLRNVICGIQLGFSSNNEIYQNNISNCYGNGIEIYYTSNDNRIFGNTIENNDGEGILIYGGPNNNNISENVINNNTQVGIFVEGGQDNTIKSNEIKYNLGGIYLIGTFFYDTKNHNIVSNKISNNRKYGLYLESSSANNIISNNFSENNKKDAYFKAEKKTHTINYWKGNYWDNWDGNVPKRIEGKIKTIFSYLDGLGNEVYYYRKCYNFDWHPNEAIYDLINMESQQTTQQTTRQQSTIQQTQTIKQIIRSNFLNRLIRR